MNAEELVAAVDELDQKIERLRVLYDQFFTGIEKIPPNVLQKDVDRRIWILRREKIRNTGTRFRFQQIIQRYNTLSSYWMRIMREIENGTYKRDVLRAKKRFGIDTSDARSTARALSERPPPAVELDVSLDDVELETSFDDLDALPSSPPPAAAPSPASTPSAEPSRPAAPPPAPRVTGIFPGAMRQAGPPPQKPPPAPPPSQQPGARPPIAPPPSRQPQRPTPIAAQSPTPDATSERPRQVHPSVPRILAAKVESDDDLDSMLDDALGPAARTPPKLPPPPSRPSAPQPAARPIQPPPSRPGVATPSPSRPGIAAPPVSRPPNVQPPISRPPIVASPAARPSVTQPAARPQPAAQRPAAASGGDEYRRVYAQFVEAKRRNGESTAGITYDTLAKSLRETTEKLKAKSGGKAIEFEVATKDGKTILKPVVR